MTDHKGKRFFGTKQKEKKKKRELSVEELYSEALNSYAEGDLKKSVSLFEQVVEIEHRNAEIWADFAMVLDSYGKIDEALDAYETSLNIDPENSDVWYETGDLLALLEEWEDAISAYDECLFRAPDDVDALSNKGFALYKLGHFEEALDLLQHAVTIDENSAESWHTLGNILDDMGESGKAITAYERAIKLSENAQYHSDKGISHFRLKDFEMAESEYRKAIETDPEYISSYHNLSELFFLTDRFEDANDILNQIMPMEKELDDEAITLFLEILIKRSLGKSIHIPKDKILEILKNDFMTTMNFESIEAFLEERPLILNDDIKEVLEKFKEKI